jgi:hypothetical protein
MRLPRDKKDTFVELKYAYFSKYNASALQYISKHLEFFFSSLVNFPKSRTSIFVIASLIFRFGILILVYTVINLQQANKRICYMNLTQF